MKNHGLLLLALNCLLIPNTVPAQATFQPTTFSGLAAQEPISLVIEQVGLRSIEGKLTDSQGTYPYTATVAGDSILHGELTIQQFQLAFSGKLTDRSNLRLNFLAPDGSGAVSSVVLKEDVKSSQPVLAQPNAAHDSRLVGTWTSTVTETSGWGESLSILSYVLVDVFYADGTYGSGKGDMQTMNSDYHGYDENIHVEKQPNVSWSTQGSTLYLDLLTENGPQKMQGSYAIIDDKLRITWSDGNEVELTRRK